MTDRTKIQHKEEINYITCHFIKFEKCSKSNYLIFWTKNKQKGW